MYFGYAKWLIKINYKLIEQTQSISFLLTMDRIPKGLKLRHQSVLQQVSNSL